MLKIVKILLTIGTDQENVKGKLLLQKGKKTMKVAAISRSRTI